MKLYMIDDGNEMHDVEGDTFHILENMLRIFDDKGEVVAVFKVWNNFTISAIDEKDCGKI